MLYFTEEILVKQRQEIISDVEKKRNIINMLVSQASESKQKEDQLNLEIACKFYLNYFILLKLLLLLLNRIKYNFQLKKQNYKFLILKQNDYNC